MDTFDPDRAPEHWYDLSLGLDLTGKPSGIDRRFGENVLVVGAAEGGRYIAMQRMAMAALGAGDEVVCVGSPATTDPYQMFIRDWLLAHATTTRATKRVLKRLLKEIGDREGVFIQESIEGSLEECSDELRVEKHLTRITLHIDGLEHFIQNPELPITDARNTATLVNLQLLLDVLKRGAKFGVHVTLGIEVDDLLEHRTRLLPRFHSRLFMTAPGRPIPSSIFDLLFPNVSEEERTDTCAVQPLNGRGYGLLGSEDALDLTALRVAVHPGEDPARTLEELRVPRVVRWPI